MEVLQTVPDKEDYKPFEVKISEELIVVISQYKSVDYTKQAILALKEDGIPFTTLVLFDGSSQENIDKIKHLVDISIVLKKRVSSLPQIYNMMFTVAKLSGAKYLFQQDADMKMRPGGLQSMLGLMKYKGYDCVSAIKIDKNEEKFRRYSPISDKELVCAGINDSSCLFRVSMLEYKNFDEVYAPYQFEKEAHSYEMWRKGAKMCIDPNAVMLHYCSQDIQHSPIEREYGSKTWDMKRDYFLKDADEKKRWFCEKSIMNAASANIYGFPIYVYE